MYDPSEPIRRAAACRDAEIRPRRLLPLHPRAQDHLRLRRPACRAAPRQAPSNRKIRPKHHPHDELRRRTTNKRAGGRRQQTSRDPHQARLRPLGDKPHHAHPALGGLEQDHRVRRHPPPLPDRKVHVARGEGAAHRRGRRAVDQGPQRLQGVPEQPRRHRQRAHRRRLLQDGRCRVPGQGGQLLHHRPHQRSKSPL